MKCKGCHWNMSFTEGRRGAFCNRCCGLMERKMCSGMANTIGLTWEQQQDLTSRYQELEVPEFEPYGFMNMSNFLRAK